MTDSFVVSRVSALAGIHHVKLPVTDPAASRDWYSRVLGFVTEIEFVEDDRLMGVAMIHPTTNTRLAVRRDRERAAALAGFDPVALAVDTRDDLDAWQRHLDQQATPHDPIAEAHIGWIITGIHDPDGIEIRIYTNQRPETRAPG